MTIDGDTRAYRKQISSLITAIIATSDTDKQARLIDQLTLVRAQLVADPVPNPDTISVARVELILVLCTSRYVSEQVIGAIEKKMKREWPDRKAENNGN